jgi:hypothetical protein
MSHPTSQSHDAEGSVSGEGAPRSPETSVPASDPGEVGRALNSASPDDDLAQAAEQGSISTGEGGRAADFGSANPPNVEALIEKIPDPHDLTVLLWAARCVDPDTICSVSSNQKTKRTRPSRVTSRYISLGHGATVGVPAAALEGVNVSQPGMQAP